MARKTRHPEFQDLDLFAGAGGLAIGIRQAGLLVDQLYDFSTYACDTLRHNISSSAPTLSGVVNEGDVRRVDWSSHSSRTRLLAAGTPCQPFSRGGHQRANRDDRNLFPEVIRAVRALRPEAVFIENVAGLLSMSLERYFEYVLRQLECPSLKPRRGEGWMAHDRRLRQHRHTLRGDPEYLVQWRLVDAADYGVAQNRKRIFIVATRVDRPPYVFPTATHSRNALLIEQEDGTYWSRRNLRRPFTRPRSNLRIMDDDGLLPWRTVRDAVMDLPKPAKSATAAWANHYVIPGARSYRGHEGSNLDWPSKAIKAGVHGVPGGENSFTDVSGTFRYYTFREAARIQSFPDEHRFCGTQSEITRQLGNAVPCELAYHMATGLRDVLSTD